MKRFPIAVLAAAILLLGGCASNTKIVNSWTAPGTSSIHFDKVAVVALSNDETVRHLAEDELVRQIHGATAVQGYTLMDEAKAGDLDSKNPALSGYDGVVTMRLVSTEKDLNWVPGAYPAPYYGFGSYYRGMYPMVYDPGYLRNDTIVHVETNVYSLADDKLVWSGISESFNPANVRELVGSIAQAIGAKLREQQLIK